MIYVVQIFINVLILEIILLVYTRLSLSLFIDISPQKSEGKRPINPDLRSIFFLPFPNNAEAQSSAGLLLQVYRENIQVLLVLVVCLISIHDQSYLLGGLSQGCDGFFVAGAPQINPINLERWGIQDELLTAGASLPALSAGAPRSSQ